MYRLLILLLFLLLNCNLSAFELKGTIKEKGTNTPIIGASVKVLGTAWGANTKTNGEFKLSIPIERYKLLISSIGYSAKQIEIQQGRDTVIEIFLESQAFQTAEVVVSASKKVQAVQDVPISVSVIDSRVLEKMNITKLDEALNFIPGVEVNQDNVSIRGSSGFSFGVGSRSLLLIDGVPLLSADTGEMKFDALPFSFIERIEIVKGAGSALYGSSALGGVINVISSKASEEGNFRLKLFSGIYTSPIYAAWKFNDRETFKSGMDISYSKKIEQFDMQLSASFLNDESYHAFNEADRFSLFSKLSYQIKENESISMMAQFTSDNHQAWVNWHSLSKATFPPDDANLAERILSQKPFLGFEYKNIINENNFYSLKSNVYGTLFRNNYKESEDAYRASDAWNWYSELQMNSILDEQISLTYGINSSLNFVDSKIYNGQSEQTIYAAFLQLEYNELYGAIITLGGRFDYEQTESYAANTEFSPKLGISYKLIDGLNLRASIGKGFRAAAIAERLATLPYGGFYVAKNESLKAESSLSYEMGFSYDAKIENIPLIIDAAIYQNNMKNMIEPGFVEGQGNTIKFENIYEAEIRGIEVGIKALLFGFVGLESSISFSEPKNISLNETLKYRSKFTSQNRVTLMFNPLEFQFDYRHKSRWESIDERLSLGIANSDVRVPVNIIDCRLIYKDLEIASHKVDFTLNAFNLLNYYYVEMVGNLGLTRHISFALNFKY